MAQTGRDIYEAYLNGENVRGKMDKLHAKVSKTFLRRQAGMLMRDSCIESITITAEGFEPWALSITFSNGELSEKSQGVLRGMRENAHRTEMLGNDVNGVTQITFYVYTFEEAEEE